MFSAANHIVTTHTLADVGKALEKAEKNAIIFVDVDDTLIAPRSKTFRTTSPYRFLIDEIKQNKKDLKNFETILSQWRLQRKSTLVAEGWPSLINQLKTQHAVYALTKMDAGAIGAIPSMERWRYEELLQKGIAFSDGQDYESAFPLVNDGQTHEGPTFYKGIFITGSSKKSDVVRQVLRITEFSQVILIDDREEQLLDVAEECKTQGISFCGIFFKGANLLPGQPDAFIAQIQKQHLMEKACWLEDEEAAQYILSAKHQ